MNDWGIVTEAGAVRFERLLPGPIERVWAYLTDSEKRGRWLASGEMELAVGGRAELKLNRADLSAEKTPPDRYKKFAGARSFSCRVTRCECPHLLSFTWGEEWGEITFELTSRGKDVHLVPTHRRLTDRTAMLDFASGWHTHLGCLADQLEGCIPRGFWSTHTQVNAEYEDLLAADPQPER